MRTPDVSLAQYALVLAARDEGASLAVALEAARVTPTTWPPAEEERSNWLVSSAADPEAMRSFDAAMKEARAALRRPVPPLDEDIGAWARWLRAWSTSSDPAADLARHGLRMADVLRLTDRWAAPMLEERALAERFAAEMQGSGPPPDVRPGPSPLLTAAEAAVAARTVGPDGAQSAPAEPLPSLLGPLPDDAPGGAATAAPQDTAAALPDMAHAPWYSAHVPSEPPAPAAPAALPSFMAAAASAPSPAPEGPSGWTIERYAALCAQVAASPAGAEAIFSEYGLSSVALRTAVDREMQARLARDPAAMEQWRAAYARHGAQHAQAAASGAAAAPGARRHATGPMAAMPGPPLPFDPNAKSAPLPSRGMQVQSGMTGDVDMSAIVRRVLAFGPAAASASPPGAAPATTPPVAPQPAAAPRPPATSRPPSAPQPPSAQPPVAPQPPAAPARPPIQVKRPPAHLTETSDVDIGAIARRVMAFEKPASPAAPAPPASTGAPAPSVPVPATLQPAPPGKRLVRFDPNTGAPLAEPYWEDIPVPPKRP